MTQIDSRMVRARANLIQRHPFWGALALHLQMEEDASVETMLTDGHRLAYNSRFLDELSERELEGVVAHEVSHCAYGHTTRRGSRDERMWNTACDYAVNRDLLRADFVLPDSALIDPAYDGMSAEEIFAVLKAEQEKKQEQQKQQDPSQYCHTIGDGSCVSDDPRCMHNQPPPSADPGKCGQVVDAVPDGKTKDVSQMEAAWKINVRQAMAVEGAKNAGNIPAHLKRMFDRIKRPLLDWKAILRRFIDERARVDYSWTKPNKRLLGHGFCIPGIIPDGRNEIGIVIDTSGSIDRKALSLFIAEVQGALDEGATKSVIVAYCDTAVKEAHTFEQGDVIKLNPSGGGGTKFRPAIEWFAKHHPDCAALIYFTDLDCSDFGEEPWVPLIWLAYGSASIIRERASRVPFGEVIHLLG